MMTSQSMRKTIEHVLIDDGANSSGKHVLPIVEQKSEYEDSTRQESDSEID